MSEQNKSCAVVVDSTAEEISISGISVEDLVIGYGSDIDLTHLVISLAKLIDTGEPNTLEMPSGAQDERVSLVLATICDIAEAYNANIEQVEEGTPKDIETWDGDYIPF